MRRWPSCGISAVGQSLPESQRAAQPAATVAATPSPWSVAMIGLCIFTFAAVTDRAPIGGIGIALGALGLVTQRSRLRAPRFLWLYVVYVGWALATLPLSDHPHIVWDQVVERLKIGALIFLIVNALRTEPQARLYNLFFLACFGLFPARSALMNLAHGYTLFGRAIASQSYAANPNDLAAIALLALGIALGSAFAARERRAVRLLAGFSALALVALIILTQSRGAFLGLVIGLGWAISVTSLRRVSTVVLALALGVAAVHYMPSTVWDRFAGLQKLTSAATISQADPEGSAEQRVRISKVAWRIFRDHPVVGVGLGVYREENTHYAPELGRRDTHDTYLNLAAELGLVGLAIWCWMFGSALLFARRQRRILPAVASSVEQIWMERALLGFLVASLFGTYSHISIPYLVLASLWCIADTRAGRAASGSSARIQSR